MTSSHEAQRMAQVAASLQIIRMDDLFAAEFGDPIALLEELTRTGVLSRQVLAALREVACPAESPARSGARLSQSDAEWLAGGTIVTERDDRPQPVGDTLAPERDQPVGGTLAPERDRPQPVGDTLAPERHRPQPDTLAPERDQPVGDTLAPERDQPVGDTLAPERDHDAPARLAPRTTASPAGGQDGSRRERSRGRRANLESMASSARRTLADAALARALELEGHLEASQVREAERAALQAGRSLESELSARGAVDPRVLPVVLAELTPLAACGHCLMIQPEGYEDGEPCVACGKQEEAPPPELGRRSRASASQRLSILGTLESSTGSGTSSASATARGIEGFPGEGGQFAGYELIRRVAEGGMGVVFEARDLNLNRIVALKVMRGGSLASRSRRRRFLAEAEAAAALHHPNIVPIHQISEVGGYPFYTMDYVEGAVLDEWVRDNKVSPRQIADMLRRVADAVHHFHLRGIIHRDLKPDNVLVDGSAEPKVIDFGIAKKIGGDFDSDTSWTVDGEVLGTPHYMPPEQAAGRVDQIDTRSDVYALGAILYQLLNEGRPPYHGVRGAANIVLAIQTEDPTPLRIAGGEHRDLEAIVAMAMAKERERRYQSAFELAQDLERYLTYAPIVARPANLAYRLRKLIRRHPISAAASAGAALVVAFSSSYASYQSRQHRLEVTRRMADARQAPLEERARRFAEVLVFDPQNPLAQAEFDKAELASERERDQERQRLALERERERRQADLRLVEERRQREVAEAELKEQQARQQQTLLEEAERERRKAQAEAQAANEARARELLEQARAATETDRLAAYAALTDGLVLVPESRGAIGAELAQEKLALCLTLGETALGRDQVGLARFWLGEATKLRASAQRAGDLERLKAEIEARSSGLTQLSAAQSAIRTGQWRVARDKLDQARARGVQESALAEDLRLVLARCADEGESRLSRARALLAEDPSEALGEARRALSYLAPPLSSTPAKELITQCAQRLRRDAQREAWELWRAPTSRPQAVIRLRQVARQISEESLPAALLEREARLRERLLREPALAARVVLVPELPELGVGPVYLQTYEVTNEEFKAFVDAKGYARAELWDPEAHELRAGFLDTTPGDPQPGPRTWSQGSYGDEANRTRPVSGVTFYEARAYARWLSLRNDRTWRLPHEVEWRVAGALDPASGALRSFPWGPDFREDALPRGSQPLPVQSNRLDQSPLGVADLGGSVAEWVLLAGGQRPGLKGAAFPFGPRVAEHFANLETTGSPGATPPVEALSAIGFRLALEVER